MIGISRRAALRVCLAAALASLAALAAAAPAYFPPPGDWARKAPAELGMDAALLAAAVAYAKAHETERAVDFSDQERTFGTLLGSMPSRRAHTNGVVIYKGFVVAEFGDTAFVDPTYSVAKSMLSTIAAVALRDGKIASLADPVVKQVRDGGYESAQNAPVSWQNHLQQESEWQGAMWGKQADFVGAAAFGAGERKPRAPQAAGAFYEYNDVRINRFALSLLRVLGKPVPDVFQDEVMGPIGASNSWKWVPYHNSYIDIGGKPMASVSGGTRWGGGMWINSWDMARFGYLWLRGGKWGDRQVVPPAYVKMATTASAHGPDYGLLWWLNTTGREWPGSQTTSFEARGQGGNVIHIDPVHDLVIVWRWSARSAEGFKRVIDAITS